MNILARFQAGWGSKDVYSCGDDELWTCSECCAEVSEEELVMLPCFHPMCGLCLAHMLMDSNGDQEEECASCPACDKPVGDQVATRAIKTNGRHAMWRRVTLTALAAHPTGGASLLAVAALVQHLYLGICVLTSKNEVKIW